jgi:long-chain acyl-CoA synthetase
VSTSGRQREVTGRLNWLLDRLSSYGGKDAIIRQDTTTSYIDLVAILPAVARLFDSKGIVPGDRVALVGDFGTLSTGCLLALIDRAAIIIPMTAASAKRSDALFDICAAEWSVEVGDASEVAGISIRQLKSASASAATSGLYLDIRNRAVPGLVLFTSGSTGEPKAVVHDFSLLLRKFSKAGRPLRTVNFLLFDHWGGLNTLLHTLSSGGVVACPESRNPEHICALIEAHRLELLPASPSFLNMLLVSGAHKRHKLDSLRMITYGAEPMPPTTLARMNREFPAVEFRQTYGLIELGVLRAKSESSESLLVKIGGEGYDVRVVDGLLEIKAESSMLGYLNAASPFTEDGYFRTGDRVEVHGEFLRILGRESEQINVGGEKVFPSEVEAVLLECPEVVDAVVYPQPHPLSGRIVCTDIVRVASATDDAAIRILIRRFCNERLEPYKVPVKIKFVEGPLTGDREKRVRIGRSAGDE